MKLFKFIPILLFLVLSIFLYKKIDNYETTKSLSSAFIDKPLPKLSLISLDNAEKAEIINVNSIIAINFFASWCIPCRKEHEVLKFFSKDIDIIGIAYKDKKENIENYLLELGNPYEKVYMDLDGKNAIELGLYGVPETYFIDKNGIIKYKHVGPINYSQFKKIYTMLARK